MLMLLWIYKMINLINKRRELHQMAMSFMILPTYYKTSKFLRSQNLTEEQFTERLENIMKIAVKQKMQEEINYNKARARRNSE